MNHIMQLRPSPFKMIEDGTKTIELRMYDEKRKRIRPGDTIVFVNMDDNSKTLKTKVIELFVFDSFEALYKELSLLECGYTEDDIDTASPKDMDSYYSKEIQQQYGVVGIKIALL